MPLVLKAPRSITVTTTYNHDAELGKAAEQAVMELVDKLANPEWDGSCQREDYHIKKITRNKYDAFVVQFERFRD